MLPEYFEFSLPTRVVFGDSIVSRMEELLEPFGDRRALLVTDAVLVQTGLMEKVRAGLAGSGIRISAVFDRVPVNSTIEAVESCAVVGNNKECNLVIGLGGGSVMDTAKVANILLAKGGRLRDYMGAYLLGNEKLGPLILIPTTAGTGSEVTKVAVIADPEHDVKLPFAETQFLPDLAILDPELTVSMPPKLTAMTGMDALTHAIEAYVDKESSPASDALALQVIRLVSGNILKACANPDDREARGAMLIASCLAGVAFSHSMVGMVHGISHALGGVYGVPHGLANALALPEVMEYNLDACPDRYADIAEALGVSFPRPVAVAASLLEVAGLHGVGAWVRRGVGIDRGFGNLAAKAGVRRIRSLNRQLAGITGMPLNLRDAGIGDRLAKIEQVVTTAMQDGSMLYNPKEPTEVGVRRIVDRLYVQDMAALETPASLIEASAGEGRRKNISNVFQDSEMLYEVLGEFYRRLGRDPEIRGPLLKSKLCVRFVYRRPDAVICIDTRGGEIEIHHGDGDGPNPEVTMILDADVAHAFWHGKINLLTALTRRKIVAKGNVPKTVKLLPILKPAYRLYPSLLREKGLDHLVLE